MVSLMLYLIQDKQQGLVWIVDILLLIRCLKMNKYA